MNSKDKIFLKKLINKYSKKEKKKYLLTPDSFSNDDIIAGAQTLLKKQITMSVLTKKFEKEFAKYVGAKYALMVNSGSSANLLAFFALINPLKKKRLNYGDECLIPSLCWSTSLWPIVQSGLKPKFIDIDTKTLNASIDQIKKNITKKTRAIMAVHVLGNSTKMDELKKITKKRKIYLIEDTCESLGSKYKKKYLGTFGDFGTYSFYYSHQITSGEGGMIVCNDKKNFEIIHSLRAHGWDRGLKKNSKIIVIGDGTYLKAKEMGIKKVINIDGNLDDLKKQIILELKKGNKILHPKSNLLDEDLFKFFKEFGCHYEPLVCYTSEKKNTTSILIILL